MLRAPNRQQLIQILEESYFGIDNYSVEFPMDGKYLFRISFLPNSQFRFSAQPPDNGGVIPSWECPAIAFVKGEPFRSSDLPGAFERVRAWTDRVKEEVISANPFSRELSVLKEDIDSRLAGMQVDLEGFFSKAEAEDLLNRLSQFEERLSQMANTNVELSDTVAALSKTVEDLQAAVGSVNRGTWFRMSASRLLSGLKAIATSKEGRELALEAAKKLLLEGPK